MSGLILSVTLGSIIPGGNTIIAKGFFKKLKRSVTKTLAESACEAIPLAQAIKQTNDAKKEFCSLLKQDIRNAKDFVKECTKLTTKEEWLNKENEVAEHSKKLIVDLLKDNVDDQKKAEIKEALEELEAIKETIALFK